MWEVRGRRSGVLLVVMCSGREGQKRRSAGGGAAENTIVCVQRVCKHITLASARRRCAVLGIPSTLPSQAHITTQTHLFEDHFVEMCLRVLPRNVIEPGEQRICSRMCGGRAARGGGG